MAFGNWGGEDYITPQQKVRSEKGSQAIIGLQFDDHLVTIVFYLRTHTTRIMQHARAKTKAQSYTHTVSCEVRAELARLLGCSLALW